MNGEVEQTILQARAFANRCIGKPSGPGKIRPGRLELLKVGSDYDNLTRWRDREGDAGVNTAQAAAEYAAFYGVGVREVAFFMATARVMLREMLNEVDV